MLKKIYKIVCLLFVLLTLILFSCNRLKKDGTSINKNTFTIELSQKLTREEFIKKHFAGIEFVETDLARAGTMIRRGNNNLKIIGDFPKTTVTAEYGVWNDIEKKTLYEIEIIDLEGWNNLLSALNKNVYLDFSEFSGSLKEPLYYYDHGYGRYAFSRYFSVPKDLFRISGLILPPNCTSEPFDGFFERERSTILTRYQKTEDTFTIVLGENFNEIPDWLFANDQRSLNIYLPKSIKRIGKYSFAGTIIESFVVPASVEEIDDGAFINCIRFQNLVFEEESKLKRIGKLAFSFDAPLVHEYVRYISNDIYLPDSVVVIDGSAFREQYKLSALHITRNSKLEVIEANAFNKTQITNVYLPETIRVIGSSAFQIKETIYKGFSNHTKANIESEYAGLSSITIASFTPPKVENLSIPRNIQNIFVPPSSLNIYKDAWFDYTFTFEDQLKPIKE